MCVSPVRAGRGAMCVRFVPGGKGMGEGGKLQDLAVMVVHLDAVWLLVLPVRLPQRGTHRVTRRGTLRSKKHQQQCRTETLRKNAAEEHTRAGRAVRGRAVRVQLARGEGRGVSS